MKKLQKGFLFILVSIFISCGGKEKKVPSYNSSKEKKQVIKTVPVESIEKKIEQTGTIDLNNKGIGPIKAITITTKIDEIMADKGKLLFKNKCSSCHRTNRKFIGPNPTGVLKRRSPEWVMNMIMNPEEMVKKDPIAKELLIKFKGSPMANQNLKKEEARQILEFFRTL